MLVSSKKCCKLSKVRIAYNIGTSCGHKRYRNIWGKLWHGLGKLGSVNNRKKKFHRTKAIEAIFSNNARKNVSFIRWKSWILSN